MGLKTTIALSIVAVGGLALGGGSAAFLYMEHQKPAEIDGALDAYDLTSVAGYTPDAQAGDRALELSHQLSGGNTLLIWEVEKNKPGGAHMEFDGTWSILTGGSCSTRIHTHSKPSKSPFKPTASSALGPSTPPRPR